MDLGALPLRARVGLGPRGLQRRRKRLELLPARPRALARVPVERGRPRRPLHAAPGPVLRARLLERRGPDPQGADLRVVRTRGEPRRGRQGVLVVPRRHPQPLLPEMALPLPAARVPLRRPRRGERPPRPDPARVRAAGHRDLRRGPLLEDRGDVRQGGPDRPLPPDPGHQRGSGGRDAARAPAPVVPGHLVVGGATRAAGACRSTADPTATSWRTTRARGRTGWLPPRGRTAYGRRRCSATTRRTASASSASTAARPTRRTRSTTTWSTAPTR